MGTCYKKVSNYIQGNFPGELVLEIGSDRWEGSSQYFAELAHNIGCKFITVDLDPDAVERARENSGEFGANADFFNAEAVKWCKEVLPTYNTKVKVLYLDNFDWDWDVNVINHEMIEPQKAWYKTQGITMSNQNCQISHFAQMQALLPYMSDECIVCIDDTYLYNDVFIGKGGPIVPYLICNGFDLLLFDKADSGIGVILGRNIKHNQV